MDRAASSLLLCSVERLLRTVSRQIPHSLALNETVLGPEGDLVSSCRSLSGSLRLLDGSASPCILGWWIERDLSVARACRAFDPRTGLTVAPGEAFPLPIQLL